MNYSLNNFLTENKETIESKQLFSSFQSGISDFDKCFSNMFLLDYSLVFGNEPKNRFIFNLLKEYYHNDFFVRYSFIKSVLSKSEAVSFEEFPIGNSRVDLASINGKSIAYEIKSEYDNYLRLEKQIKDYSKCFEYVYVVCPYSKIKCIKKHLPDYCGIYSYSGVHNLRFVLYKKAKHSPNLSSETMILSLRKADLKKTFSTDNYENIIKSYSMQKIIAIFKATLKARFKKKWALLKEEACFLN